MNFTDKIKNKLFKPFAASILDSYLTAAPSAQTALDIFQGEWASKMPGELRAGGAQLFDDERIKWLLAQLGTIEDYSILELGPLEAGHTLMLEQAGAGKIVGVEANTRAFLKCLIVKEIFKLKKAEFLCGDFVEYLRQDNQKFDLCVASGVLYHLKNPLELLSLAARRTDKLFVWTHYYDAENLSRQPEIFRRFTAHETAEFEGFAYRRHLHNYTALDLSTQSFCGGSASFSCWLERAAILGFLEKIGFRRIEIAFDEPAHQNGASLALLATK